MKNHLYYFNSLILTFLFGGVIMLCYLIFGSCQTSKWHYFVQVYLLQKINGELNEQNYSGMWRKWYLNGQIMSEIEYLDGQRFGIETEWYENGKLRSIGRFDAKAFPSTRLDKVISFLKSEPNWLCEWKGSRIGEHFEYFENGNKKYHGNWKSGKPHGVSKVYYKNKILGIESNWNKGVLDGESKVWDETGKLICIYKYELGNLITKVDFNIESK